MEANLSDPSAFAAVYERHMPRVLAYLRRRVGDELAEDLTAETFVRAFRGRVNYSAQHDSPLPWLLGIASNLIGDHRRAERRRLAAIARLAAQTPVAAAPAGDSLSAGVAEALRRLPASDRDTLLLVVWGELSYEETAQALGIPIGTVRSRVARARSRLTGGPDGLTLQIEGATNA